MKEFEALLENFWIVKEQEPDLFQRVKDACGKLKPFVESKLGYRLLVNPAVIKMEKLPAEPESWMGIERFTTQMEYALLCILLVFLEDYGKQEQFVLSQLTDFIKANYGGADPLDWTMYRHRFYVVRVLNFAQEYGFFLIDDGDSDLFTADSGTEVLYESTGISRYFARNFYRNILSFESIEDLLKNNLPELYQDRGIVRRQRVYRRLFLSPAVIPQGPDDQDFLYLKNFRSMIQKELADLLDSELHIHKSCALVILNEDKNFRMTLPDQKVITAIVLQICTATRALIEGGGLTLNEDDTVVLSLEQLEQIIDDCREINRRGWSKEFREMPSDELYQGIIEYMEGFSLLKKKNAYEWILLPPAGKISGRYPRDFGGQDDG